MSFPAVPAELRVDSRFPVISMGLPAEFLLFPAGVPAVFCAFPGSRWDLPSIPAGNFFLSGALIQRVLVVDC